MFVRKRPHSLLVDHQVVRMKNIAVKFHGGSALDEKIVSFDQQKRGFKIQNLRVPLGKPKPYMYDAELIFPRKRDGFRGHAHHAFGIRHEAEDSFLKIQSQKRRFWGIEFHALFFCVFGRQVVMTFPLCA